MARIQYTPHVEPVSIQPEITSVDRWWKDFSLPVWARVSVSAAAIASGMVTAVWPHPETTTVDRWWRDLSQPYPAKVGLPVQEQLAYVAPVSEAPEKVSEDRWHQPLSLPVWSKTSVSAAAIASGGVEPLSEKPETTTEDRWHQPFSQPYPAPRFVAYQQPVTAPLSEQPESVSIDRWLQPFSLPVPIRYKAPEGWFAWGILTPAAVVVAPFIPEPWPDVTRVTARVPWQLPLVEPVSEAQETTTVDRWYRDLSLPVPPKQPVPYQQTLAEPLSEQPETTSVDRWYQQLGLPVWSRYVQPTGLFTQNTYPIPPLIMVPPLAWLGVWRDFILPAINPNLYAGYFAWSNFKVPPPPALTGATGSRQTHVPYPAGLHPSRLHSFAWSDFTPSVAIVAPFIPEQVVDMFRVPATVPWQQPITQPVSEALETTTVDRWHQPLSLPVWSRYVQQSLVFLADPISLPPSLIPAGGTGSRQTHVPYPIGLHPSRLHSFASSSFTPPSTPIIVPTYWVDQFRISKFLTATQQAYFGPVSEAQETVSIDRWLQPFVQPYPALRFVPYQMPWSGPTWPFSETVSEDRWHQPLAQPYPAKQFVAYQQPWVAPVSEAPETTTVDRWWLDLSRPTLPKLPVAWQQAMVVPISEAPETVSIDRWLQPLSLPVLPRRSPEGTYAWGDFTPVTLIAPVVPSQWPDVVRPVAVVPWQNPSTAPVSEAPETVTEDRWHQPWTQPYPSKPALYAANQQFYAAPLSEQPETTTVDRYWQQLSQPYLAKVYAQQQPYTAPVSEAKETITVDRWWQDLSRHPGLLPALSVAQQPFGQVPFGAIQTQAITISQVQWHWNTHAMVADQQQPVTISEVTWHWNPFALTFVVVASINITEATWHWATHLLTGTGIVSGKGRFNTAQNNVWGVIRSVIKSVVLD
jgi:hypothetical protein